MTGGVAAPTQPLRRRRGQAFSWLETDVQGLETLELIADKLAEAGF